MMRGGKGLMNHNHQRLGETIDGRMKKAASAAIPTGMELGVINSNLSLTTDSLKTPIPKGDYMVNLMLNCTYDTSIEQHSHSGGSHGGHTGGDGVHSHSGGDHKHTLPDGFRLLKPGDRVLVAWCGNEPVVVAIVISS